MREDPITEVGKDGGDGRLGSMNQRSFRRLRIATLPASGIATPHGCGRREAGVELTHDDVIGEGHAKHARFISVIERVSGSSTVIRWFLADSWFQAHPAVEFQTPRYLPRICRVRSLFTPTPQPSSP